MSITAEYDRDADALYVRLSEGERARTVEVDDVTYLDVDAEGRALGIELLYPSMGIKLEEVARRFGLEDQIPAIVGAIEDSGAPGTTPTFTRGNPLASTTITTVSIEGTIAASREVTTVGVGHADPFIHICA